MKIGILGTGVVGRTLGTWLARNGHEVMLGARAAGNSKAVEWARPLGDKASEGTFSDAAAHGEIVFNCTAGAASLEALEAAGRDTLAGKILIDVANPLDFSKGMPPSLTVCNTDSLGEQIQRQLPDTKVVKALNTVNCDVMVDPGIVPGDHDLFICGEDLSAKKFVIGFLSQEFGWKASNIRDLGGIAQARGTEMYLALWVRLYGALGNAFFNVHVVRGAK